MYRAALCLIAFLIVSVPVVAGEPARQTWSVDGVEREGLVYAPESAKKSPTPIVFVFHGHGGSMKNAARQFHIHDLWPEAIAVYLQGLNTPGRLTDPEGKKPGWQSGPGDQGTATSSCSIRS